MTKSIASWFVTGFLFVVASPALAQPSSAKAPEKTLQITVRIYDYAQISPRTLRRAQDEATYVFRQAGVEVLWLECHSPNHQQISECSRTKGPAEFELRILGQTKNGRQAFKGDTLGYAARDSDGSGGTMASVFYDRVQEVGRREGFSEGMVLGYAVAHEIGHLLLLSEYHSPTGLMRAKLTLQNWQQAAKGSLLFTNEQAESIRAIVLAKVNQEERPERSAKRTSPE